MPVSERPLMAQVVLDIHEFATHTTHRESLDTSPDCLEIRQR